MALRLDLPRPKGALRLAVHRGGGVWLAYDVPDPDAPNGVRRRWLILDESELEAVRDFVDDQIEANRRDEGKSTGGIR